jgi:hypothetical protein
MEEGIIHSDPEILAVRQYFAERVFPLRVFLSTWKVAIRLMTFSKAFPASNVIK